MPAMHAETDDFLLTGERAALGFFKREHAPDLARWFNDPEIRKTLAHRGVVNADAEEKWYEQVTEAAAEVRPSAVHFAIHDRSDGALVGVAGLQDIDHSFARAEFGIFVGRRRGQGLGTDATRLVLDWAFYMIGLRNVMLEVVSWNEQAQRAYQRAGFREIGPRRGAILALGERSDAILMDAHIDDFESPVLRALRPS
jgi:RimJ/RimL family protein N-acetyltransferase